MSILQFFIFDGNPLYDGMLYYKAYLFILLTFVLVISRHDFFADFCVVLSFLSVFTIVIFLMFISNPFLGQLLYETGLRYGNLAISQRQYGTYIYYAIFFRTSPMLVFAICYYAYRFSRAEGSERFKFCCLWVLNLIGLFLSGVRTNIVMSVFLGFFFAIKYSRNRKIVISALLVVAVIVLIREYSVLVDMFSAHEVSNNVKLGYLSDYYLICSNVPTLLFGQGLGAYSYWSSLHSFSSQTELTYLEIFRSYGLVFGIPMFLILFYPLLIGWKSRTHKYLFYGYFSYLLISAGNPYLFSSSGMLVLSLVLTGFLCKNKSIGCIAN